MAALVAAEQEQVSHPLKLTVSRQAGSGIQAKRALHGLGCASFKKMPSLVSFQADAELTR